MNHVLHRLAAVLPSIVRGDPETKSEEPRPHGPRPVVFGELTVDDHEDLMRHIFDVPLGHAQAP